MIILIKKMNVLNVTIVNENLHKIEFKSMKLLVKKHKKKEKFLILRDKEIMQKMHNKFNFQHRVNLIKKNKLQLIKIQLNLENLK